MARSAAANGTSPVGVSGRRSGSGRPREALVTCVIFVIGFRDRVSTAGEEKVGYDAVAQTEP